MRASVVDQQEVSILCLSHGHLVRHQILIQTGHLVGGIIVCFASRLKAREGVNIAAPGDGYTDSS